MKTYLKTLIVAALIVCAPVTASAGSPHWLDNATTAAVDDVGDLVIEFKLAGLGSAVSTEVTASAQASAVWACQTNSGNWPADPKKTTLAGPVTGSGWFTSGKNGSIQDVLVLAPPAPGAGFCPPGQTATLVSVSYSDVTLDEIHAGPYVFGGSYARTFYVI